MRNYWTGGNIGPEILPEGATRLGPLVAYEFDPSTRFSHGGLIIWHWCDHHLWAGRPDFDAHPEEYRRWVPAGVGAHQLVSADPLHLEPSVYWPDCCGLHGWIRAGAWTDA